MNSVLSLLNAPETDVRRGQLKSWDDIGRFVFGGNATFTLVGKSARYTFRVRKPKPDAVAIEKYGQNYFVSLLRGPSNEDDYAYMGVIDKNGFHATKNSRMGMDAPSWKAFAWFFARLQQGGEPCHTLEFWHEGKCGRCGRKLTVPESVERGIGPECAGRME